MNLRSCLLFFFATGVLVVSSGCAASTALPFHVLMMPPTQAGRVDSTDDPTSPFDLQATIAPLQDALEDRFVRVTWATSSQTSDLFAEAERVRADLICLPTFRPGAGLAKGLNAKALFNIPLFFVWGPISHLVDDRAFRWEEPAKLDLDFWVTTGGGATLSDANRLVPSGLITAESNEIELDFVDRAGTHWSRYLWTIIVPPSFVATDVDEFGPQIAYATAESLTDAIDIASNDKAFHYASSTGGFALQHDGYPVVRTGRDEVRVRAVVQPERGMSIASATIETITEVEGTDPRTGRVRVPHEGRGPLFIDVELNTEADWIRIIPTDARQRTRGFTFRVR